MELRSMIDAYETGVRVELGPAHDPGEHGVHILALGNYDYLRRQDELDAAYREANKIEPEARLPSLVRSKLINQAAAEILVKGWWGYEIDGVTVEDRDDDSAVHVENAIRLISLPPVADEWFGASRKLEAAQAKAVEQNEKNSSTPSLTS